MRRRRRGRVRAVSEVLSPEAVAFLGLHVVNANVALAPLTTHLVDDCVSLVRHGVVVSQPLPEHHLMVSRFDLVSGL